MFFLVLAIASYTNSAWAKLVVHSLTSVELELLSYNGLAENSIFKGNLEAGSKHEVNTHYHGLAVLVVARGQRYPIIIGDKSFTLKIADPGKPPFFAGSVENDYFYNSLKGGDLPPKQYDFALLMIQAIDLLKSSQAINTVKELKAKKEEFHEFVLKNYAKLKHSDMIKRLIAQYFVMHEYVTYRAKGAPATDIRTRYQKEVIEGVGSWIETLKPHLPEQEILNYCVSLYYNRSMVTLASRIIGNFRDVAYCPGADQETVSLPGDLLITDADGNKEIKLGDFRVNQLIAFVSEDCPVSMVETISRVRQLAIKKENMPVIVAPIQKLSSNHLIMAKMVSNGKMLFVNDEKWRKANLPKKIKLPLFVRHVDDSDIR